MSPSHSFSMVSLYTERSLFGPEGTSLSCSHSFFLQHLIVDIVHVMEGFTRRMDVLNSPPLDYSRINSRLIPDSQQERDIMICRPHTQHHCFHGESSSAAVHPCLPQLPRHLYTPYVRTRISADRRRSRCSSLSPCTA